MASLKARRLLNCNKNGIIITCIQQMHLVQVENTRIRRPFQRVRIF